MFRFACTTLAPHKSGSRKVAKAATGVSLPPHKAGHGKSSVSAAAAPSTSSTKRSLQEHQGSDNANTAMRKNAGKLGFDDSKAGLQKVDKAHVEQVIREASEGSAFYKKEQRREEMRREKVAAMLKKAEGYNALSPSLKQMIHSKVDVMLEELEATRDLRRKYIHLDMDMFYAAVEEKKNPKLRDVPFGVGSNTMLSTTNYIARQYGVRSGMPGFIGRKLCPEIIIVPNDFRAYKHEASVVHNVAARFDPQFVSLGLDELTMDITKYLEQYPGRTPSQVANEFREEINKRTQLTCSAGIAPTSALAKIASNVNKPNGQHEIVLITRDDVLEYVKQIPLRQIPGIGYAQESMLNALNIHNCGDLLKQRYILCYLFKEKTFRHYMEVGLGLMETFSHKQHEIRQSIGKESSFSDPLPSEEALVKLFRKMLEQCHVQCVRERLCAGQMRLVLKYRTYDAQQFSLTFPRPTNDLKLWLDAAEKLLAPHLERYGDYRLVGVRLQKLIPVDTAIAEASGKRPSSQLEMKINSIEEEAEEEAEEEEDEEIVVPVTNTRISQADTRRVPASAPPRRREAVPDEEVEEEEEKEEETAARHPVSAKKPSHHAISARKTVKKAAAVHHKSMEVRRKKK